MYIKKYINIDTLLIMFFITILSVSVSYQKVGADTRNTTTINHNDVYSEFHKEALLRTEIISQTFIDVILDEAEKYDVYPKKEVKVDVKTLDMTSLERFISTVPSEMRLPITIVDEFRTFLSQYYHETYNTLKSSYQLQSQHLSQESLVSPKGGRGENIYDISEKGMKRLIETEDTIDREKSNADQFKSKTASLDSRKQSFPKMPKTTVPPPSEPHCMTAGVNKKGNSFEKDISDVEDPPVQELDNLNIKEQLLYANDDGDYNLRAILTQTLEENIEKELTKYHKKRRDDGGVSFTNPLDNMADIQKDEAMIAQNVLSAFVFSKNMEDLEKRHKEWQSSLEKIEEVVLQIKELEGIKTDISEKRSNYSQML